MSGTKQGEWNLGLSDEEEERNLAQDIINIESILGDKLEESVNGKFN